jgi:LysM repeat protein
MKILISGIVVGIHLLALILILANPGCSSSAKAPPAKSETVSKGEPPPIIAVPAASSSAAAPSAPPISFNVDPRYSPTRPGSAAATTLETEPVSNVTPATTYTVISGDNPTVIAKKNHITIPELAAANNFNANTVKLRPGQKLIIPSKSPAPAKTVEAGPGAAGAKANVAAATKPSAELMKHTVKAGETLGGIAQKYGVKLGAIAEANSITDPLKIRPGMELVIPEWKATSEKSSRSQKSAANPEPTTKAVTPANNPPTTTPMVRSTPPGEVPVIQVEEAPAASK